MVLGQVLVVLPLARNHGCASATGGPLLEDTGRRVPFGARSEVTVGHIRCSGGLRFVGPRVAVGRAGAYGDCPVLEEDWVRG